MASGYDSFSETQSAEVGVRLWPVMDEWGSGAEVGGEGGEVEGVGGENAVEQAEGEGHEMGVDDVWGLGPAEQSSHYWGIGKGEIVYLYCSEELGEPGLSAFVAPHLGDNWSGRVQHSTLLQCGGQEGVGGVLAAVDCYEKSRVEDHLGK